MNLKKNTIKVIIRCITYNHEKYIEDALKGFVKQKTDFPFAAIVIDDASTDGEQEILWNFINKELDSTSVQKTETSDYVKVVASHKLNKNCTFVILFLKYNHYSIKKFKTPYFKDWQDSAEYIAFCEGDDYWIDPLKLQKQVNILDKYPNCSLVLSNGYTGIKMDENSKLINPYLEQKTGFLSMHTLLLSLGGLVPTASMCYRKSLPPRPEFFYVPFVGDKPLRIWCALNGKVYYYKEPMTFYRKSGGDSFGNRVGNNKDFAKNIYVNFCNFLDELNEYTKQIYEKEITFMKEKEEFYYLCRIGDPNIFKCSYYRSPYVHTSKKHLILLFLRYKTPIIYHSSRYIYHFIKRIFHL